VDSTTNQEPHAQILVPFDATGPVERVLRWVRMLWDRQAPVLLLDLTVTAGQPAAPASGTPAAGGAVERIVAVTRERPIGLIAMAGAAGDELVESVVRTSPVPVMVVPAAAIEQPLRRLIVPLDGSEPAAQVLPVVEALARRHRLLVNLLTVIDPDQVLHPALANNVVPGTARYAELLGGLQSDAQRLLARAAARLLAMRVPTTWDLRFGPAAGCIAGIARPGDAIVMTTHGRGPSQAGLGSVAADVIQLSRVPVVAFRTVPVADTVVQADDEVAVAS
jgi:nucleotide-binding universal stress UspA family protein